MACTRNPLTSPWPSSLFEDCLEFWLFSPASVEYIHMSWLFGSIDDWCALYKQAFQRLKPGGYLESHEASPLIRLKGCDSEVSSASAIHQWGNLFVEAGRRSQRSFTVVEDGLQAKAMKEAGFVDIQDETLEVSP